MIALAAETVSKRYRVRPRGGATVLDALRGRLRATASGPREVWALRDVSVAIEQGRALGVIGHNGAGKSTLLRVLCGITLPTRGRVTSVGAVGALLELGGGFHLDCTGRQNLMTAGLLTGLTAAEVRARQDEVVAFAELEDVIDRPVRTYSTGMYLRLAFAAAVHLDPEILVVDEVLAVGDARFQQKCLARIAAFRAAGRTLVLASHMPEQIKALCDEVLVLDEGQAVMRGTPVEAFGRYDQLMEERTERRRHALGGGPAVAPAVGGGARRGTQEGSIEGVRLQDLDGRVVTTIATGEPLAVELDLRLPAAAVDFALDLGVYSDADEKCFEVLIKSGATTFGLLEERATVRCVLPALPLRPARYLVAVGLYPPDYDHTWDYHSRMHGLLVEGEHADHVTGVVDVHPRWHVVAPVSGPPAER